MIAGAAFARLLLVVVAGWLTLVWVCGAVYVAATYVSAQPYLPRRSPAQTALWVLRECWVVAWTQPLTPAYQVLGKHVGGGGGPVPVVFVHGYFQNRVDFIYLARRLRRAGAGPLYACNFFWPQDLNASSADVREFVQGVREQTGASAVDLVTHSTGGLFALDLIAENPSGVRRAVLLALPASGVKWRGPLLGPAGNQLRSASAYIAARTNKVTGVPVLSAYSEDDNVVHPVATSHLEGGGVRNLCVEGPGHLSLLFDRRIGDAVCDFLLDRRD